LELFLEAASPDDMACLLCILVARFAELHGVGSLRGRWSAEAHPHRDARLVAVRPSHVLSTASMRPAAAMPMILNRSSLGSGSYNRAIVVEDRDPFLECNTMVAQVPCCLDRVPF
jgi:hypothetical protein